MAYHPQEFNFPFFSTSIMEEIAMTLCCGSPTHVGQPNTVMFAYKIASIGTVSSVNFCRLRQELRLDDCCFQRYMRLSQFDHVLTRIGGRILPHSQHTFLLRDRSNDKTPCTGAHPNVSFKSHSHLIIKQTTCNFT